MPTNALDSYASSSAATGWTSFSAWWFIGVPHLGHVIAGRVNPSLRS